MASCTTGSTVMGTPTTPSNAQCTLQGNSWTGFSNYCDYGYNWGVSSVGENDSGITGNGGTSGGWTDVVSPLSADKTYKFRAWALDVGVGTYYGSVKTRKTNAMAATASAPTSSAVTSEGATISCNYYPNTLESLATVLLEYKRTVDTTWIQAGVTDTGKSGYSLLNISRTLTGLDPSTQYDFRLRLTRTTNNLTTLTSASGSFTTTAGVPAVTTDAPSNLAARSATLNGTLALNAGTDVNCYFMWGTDNPPTQNQTANQPLAADGSFSEDISGLSPSTTYYVQAFASFTYPAGSPSSGAVASFATPADPGVAAVQEARMQVYEFTRRYGVALAAGAAPLESGPLVFTLQTPAGTNSDTFVVGASFQQADITISLDGAAPAAITNVNQISTLGNGYALVLTAAEMAASEIDVFIKDVSGLAFRDAHLRVITHRQYGSMVLDCATGSKPNATALLAKGYGSGHGISAVKGATGSDIDGVLGGHVIRHGTFTTGAANPIDTGASAVNDFYNNMLLMVIAGTGVGQARIIKDYDGATFAFTPNRAWSTNPGTGAEYVVLPGADVWNVSPGAELTAIPTFNSSFGQLLQLVFQRFAYKITQTATVQTLFKSVAGGQTALGARTVSDDGSTQTIGELS